jgi:septal ring factor EnvC (AmiA/AmiB activator)
VAAGLWRSRWGPGGQPVQQQNLRRPARATCEPSWRSWSARNAKLKAGAKEHGRAVKDLESQVEQLRRELKAARAAEASAVKVLDRLKAHEKARKAEEKAARQAESPDMLATPDDDVEDGSGGAGGVEGVRDEDERGSAGVE